jgi:hypothetical protein
MQEPILTEDQQAVKALRDRIVRQQGPAAETPGGVDPKEPRESQAGVVKLTEQPK